MLEAFPLRSGTNIPFQFNAQAAQAWKRNQRYKIGKDKIKTSFADMIFTDDWTPT